MSSDLWRNINYKYPLKFCHNTFIREYDMSKANINSLLYTNRISKDYYDYLYQADKQTREIQIGLMIQKDPSIYQSIQEGIMEGKKRLFESNDLKDSDILSIKNDAVFVMRKELQYTAFDNLVFVCKNVYTIYMQILDLEIYYGDNINMDGSLSTNIDVKGINDSLVLNYHSPGILDIISDTCYLIQHDTAMSAIQYLSDIYRRYINRELDINYYREFNYESRFVLNTYNFRYSLDTIDERYKDQIDINRNLLVLRDLLYIVSEIYNIRKKT